MGSDEVVESEILEGADLCVGCLFPVRPGSELCVKCGAPHGSLAGFLPLLRVLAEGYVLRQAVQNPPSWFSVFGIWVIFGANLAPVVLILPLLIGPSESKELGLLDLLGFGGGIIVTGLLSIAGIIQSTRNFRRRKRA